MAKEVAAPRIEEVPACRLLLLEAETEVAAEAEAGPLDSDRDQVATGLPEREEGSAGRVHEVAGNAGTVPSMLSKAVCVHSESTHPIEILKNSLACGHKIPLLGM